MATLKGVGLLFGIGQGQTLTFTPSGGSALSVKTQGLDYEKSGEKADLRNEDGSEVGRVYYNIMKKLTVTAIPFHATTISGAITNAEACAPAIGTAVAVVDNQMGSETDGTHTGNYVIDSVRVARTNTGIAVFTLELEQVLDNDISPTRT